MVAAPMTTQTSLQTQVLTAAASCSAGGTTSTEPTGPDAGSAPSSAPASPPAAASPPALPGNLLAINVATLINAELTGTIAAASALPRSTRAPV